MKLETISTRTGAKAQIHRVRVSKKWVVLAPGFGSSIKQSALMQACIERVQGKCNLLLIDHPHFGINADMPEPENFTLDLCRDHTRECLEWLLSQKGITDADIALLGNSLGFWTLDQATRDMGKIPMIRVLFGKSGIASYESILQRIIKGYGSIDSALENFFKIGTDGWGQIQINPTDPPIRIHRNFIESVLGLRENEELQTHRTEVVHAMNDDWTFFKEMQAHIAGPGNHIYSRNDGHGMTGGVDDIIDINYQLAYRLFDALGLHKKARPETWDELAEYYAGKIVY